MTGLPPGVDTLGLSAFKKLAPRLAGGGRGVALGSGGVIVLLVVGMASAEERQIPVAPPEYLKYGKSLRC